MSESGIAQNLYLMPEREESAVDRAFVKDRSLSKREFEEIYAKYSPLVNGIVLSKVPYGDAEDVVQEVFISAFLAFDQLRDKEAVGPWLAIIARNKAAGFYRKRKPTEELSEHTAGTRADLHEANEALDVIRSLPAAYSETLTLRLVEGMTGPEIASLTGKQEASVRVNLHRGMKMLRKKLGIRKGTKS